MLPDRDRPALLASIIAEGDRRRRRRHLVSGGGLAAVALLAGVVLWPGAEGRDGDDLEVAADDADDETTTTAKPERTTTTGVATTTTGPADEQPGGEDPDEPPDDEPDPGLECRNSDDPACGEFYWDYDPATFPNAPAEISLSTAPAVVVAGEPAVLTFEITDPDGSWRCGSVAQFEGASEVVHLNTNGDEGIPWNLCVSGCGMQSDRRFRYGPWDPPPPPEASAGRTWYGPNRVTYDAPGTYTVTGTIETGYHCLGDNLRDSKPFFGYNNSTPVSFSVEVVAPVEPGTEG